jgi:MoxR-like ATPase
VPQDVFDIAPEVLRHRVTLTYDALAEGVHPEAVVERLLRCVPAPSISPQQAVYPNFDVTLPMEATG